MVYHHYILVTLTETSHMGQPRWFMLTWSTDEAIWPDHVDYVQHMHDFPNHQRSTEYSLSDRTFDLKSDKAKPDTSGQGVCTMSPVITPPERLSERYRSHP